MGTIVLAVAFVAFTAPDGATIMINPDEVVVIRGQSDTQLLTPVARCVIGTTDAKFITVLEDCDTVKRKLRGE